MSDWGPWCLDRERRVLWAEHEPAPLSCEVRLDDCLTSAQVLGQIYRVTQEAWADPVVVAGLVNALNDVIGLEARFRTAKGSPAANRRPA